jgi:hypothetical protein
MAEVDNDGFSTSDEFHHMFIFCDINTLFMFALGFITMSNLELWCKPPVSDVLLNELGLKVL